MSEDRWEYLSDKLIKDLSPADEPYTIWDLRKPWCGICVFPDGKIEGVVMYPPPEPPHGLVFSGARIKSELITQLRLDGCSGRKAARFRKRLIAQLESLHHSNPLFQRLEQLSDKVGEWICEYDDGASDAETFLRSIITGLENGLEKRHSLGQSYSAE